MRTLKAFLPPAVGGCLASVLLTSVLVAAEGRQRAGTVVVASEPEAESEALVLEDDGLDASCQVLVPCGGLPLGMLWWEADYLLWWAKGMEIPPLVTGGTTGVLGTSPVLYGDDQILDEARSGFRVGLGSWLDCGRCFGVEGDYWMLGEATDHFRAESNAQGSPALFRPFFNINPRDEAGEFAPPAREDAEIVSSPGVLAGSVVVDSYSDLQGAGIRWRRQLCCQSACDTCADACGCQHALARSSRLDLLVGYRFVQLKEGLAVNEALASLLSAPDQGQFAINDSFQTANRFHGADLGVTWRRRCGPWLLDVLGKLSLGGVEQTVRIAGQTVISGSAADNGTYAGGLLAQSTNINVYRRNVFAMVPELGINLGYQLAPWLTAKVGYSFLYWSRVVRPGDQIDLVVNPDLLPPPDGFAGAERPRFEFRDADFWAQGLRVGLEGRW